MTDETIQKLKELNINYIGNDITIYKWFEERGICISIETVIEPHSVFYEWVVCADNEYFHKVKSGECSSENEAKENAINTAIKILWEYKGLCDNIE